MIGIAVSEGPYASADAPAPSLSVIVPTLDEAPTIATTLAHHAALDGGVEVIVVDGGSRDGTAQIARGHPTRPLALDAPRGRARQMNAGAAAARGAVLVFLHADTRLPPDAPSQVAAALAAGREGGNFVLRFDGFDRFSRVLGRWYALQRRMGVYYGDSAIWVRAETFRALGGYRELPIMEDYDLVRRLERRGRTACLTGPAITSARRWRTVGLVRTIATWVVIRWLFVAGVPVERLARLYPKVR